MANSPQQTKSLDNGGLLSAWGFWILSGVQYRNSFTMYICTCKLVNLSDRNLVFDKTFELISMRLLYRV